MWYFTESQKHYAKWKKSDSKGYISWGAWLAQLEEYTTLDLVVMSLSPMLGIEITKKKTNNVGIEGGMTSSELQMTIC